MFLSRRGSRLGRIGPQGRLKLFLLRSSQAQARRRVRVHLSAIRVHGSSGDDILICSRIDANADPGHDAVLDVVSEEDVLHDGVHASGLLEKEVVFDVPGEDLLVDLVCVGGFDFADEVLVEEDLAGVGSMGGEVAAQECAVSADGGVIGVVCEHVDVSGTAGVVAGEDGLELSDTVDIGLLDTAEEGCFEVGGIVTVSVAPSSDTTVDTGGVAVPDIHDYSKFRSVPLSLFVNFA